MIRFDIITLFPRLIENNLEHSIFKRAIHKKLLSIQSHDLRNFGIGKHRQVDDYQYGGGAGMVMMIEPVDKCISHIKSTHTVDEIIYLTPDGKKFTQKLANTFSLKKNLILLCGHYKGIDERVRQEYITHEVSIGDYVLSGGELPALVFMDAVVRLIPGVLNDETAALSDSFQDEMLSYPVYTRPSSYEGLKVPDILLSGDFLKIEEWRERKAHEKTKKNRPDLLKD